MADIEIVVRSRFGRATLAHRVVIKEYATNLYAKPTPPALCGAAPGGGWVAMPGPLPYLADCPRCVKRSEAMDAPGTAIWVGCDQCEPTTNAQGIQVHRAWCPHNKED